MKYSLTILVYTFPKEGSESVPFEKIRRSIETTWNRVGRYETVIVANHRFEELDAFVTDHENVRVQIEPTLVYGQLQSMSLDCVAKLHMRFKTEYVLIIQDDGFPLKGNIGDFIGKYDYIGAPTVRDDRRKLLNRLGFPCLNGGFSLRTRKLCRAASRNWRWFWRFVLPVSSRFFAEDTFYTMTACLNPFYRLRYRFANEKEGFSFSYDHLNGLISKPDNLDCFGFHGKSTMVELGVTS